MLLWETEADDPAGQVHRHPTDRLRFSNVPPRTSQYCSLDASLPRTRGHPRYDATSPLSAYFCPSVSRFILSVKRPQKPVPLPLAVFTPRRYAHKGGPCYGAMSVTFVASSNLFTFFLTHHSSFCIWNILAKFWWSLPVWEKSRFLTNISLYLGNDTR